MKKIYFPAFKKFESIKSNHTPEIIINDPKTGDAVRSDFRTILLNYLADINGEPATDAIGYFEVTLLELQTLQTDNAVQPGYFYYITDRDIMLQGVATDAVTLHGAYYVKVGVGMNEVDYVEFDVMNDIMLRRRDKRGNDVALSKQYLDDIGLPYTTIDEFYWVNDKVFGNTVVDSYVLLDGGLGSQYAGTFRDNTIINRSVVNLSSIITLSNALFSGNSLSAASYEIYSDPTSAYQVYNNVLVGSSVEENSEYAVLFYHNSLSGQSSYVNDAVHSNCIVAWNNLESNSAINIYDTGMSATRPLYLFRNAIRSGSVVNMFYSNNSSTTFSYSEVSQGSTVTLTDVFNTVSRTEVSNGSSMSITSTSALALQFLDIRVLNKSTLTISSYTANLSFGEVTVTDSSTFTVSGTDGFINNIFIGDNAAVTLTANTTNKTNIVINRWTVTLHADKEGTDFTLSLTMDSSFIPVWRSTFTQFVSYASRVAAGVFSFAVGSADAYTGFYYVYTTGGGSISSFANTTTVPDQMAILFQAGVTETLTFVQDAVPVAAGGIGMNVASITLLGQDGNITGDTLTLQKSPNERFGVIDYFNFT